MSDTIAELSDFNDREIEEEYVKRFGDPNKPSLSDFSSRDLIDEISDRDAVPEDWRVLDELDEIADLIAEAAHSSPHAKRAYELLRAAFQAKLPILAARQSLIAGRMGGLPL